MAQAEDTELRDLVIESLEKNGSLAKVRALLRANIFLAFEDECENKRHNMNLDNILKLPEGILSLCVIHEFLEFCNLKNTLFVYMSESRQGKDYNYDGKKILLEKLNLAKHDSPKEPVLVKLIRNILKPCKKYFDQSDDSNLKKHENCGDFYKDEQNSTYIVHEDSQSSTTSNSNSDNSSDEKNKLHLRLQLDNSDTDTSSESTRDKTSSEYVPNDHIIEAENKNHDSSSFVTANNMKTVVNHTNSEKVSAPFYMHEFKMTVNSSSDSTSYADLKPYSSLDEKLINTSGVPSAEICVNTPQSLPSPKTKQNDIQSKVDSAKSATLGTESSISLKNEYVNQNKVPEKKSPPGSGKSDVETAEYSFDFSSSHVSRHKDGIDENKRLTESAKEDFEDMNETKNSLIESPHQNSQSSQSSVSISDVADLISEKSSSFSHQTNDKSPNNVKSRLSTSNHLKKVSDSNQSKFLSDDSGDFTVSPVPSLSNLSLDIHSD